MKPILRFNSIVISLTTVVMYLIWAIFNSTIFANMSVTTIAIIISYFTSIGFYRTIFKILSFLLSSNRWFKKLIFGNYFFEGTWVGFFIGHDSNVKYFYEIHEQSLDSLVITGTVFRNDDSIHGTWKATDSKIQVVEGKLTYYYEADMYGNDHINPGFASFSIGRDSKSKCPQILKGFSSDLFSAMKLVALEEKYKDFTVNDDEVLLEMAKELYKKNKKYYK